MQQKKQQEEEDQMKKQQEEEEKTRELPMPSSPQRGPKGPIGSTKKQKASSLLEQQRKTMSGPGGHN